LEWLAYPVVLYLAVYLLSAQIGFYEPLSDPPLREGKGSQ
jgi:hypothetical protein